ncbi:MAG: hypothetical protein KDC98_23660 [Planctomycetes bacterium]|nr:hypothetical protein [Planctomycetota bacterium]
MSPATRALAWSTTAAVAATGGVYAVMAYCMTPDDPMDIVNHPWQPAVLHWHVLAAPLWLFALGVLWQSHVWPKLRSAARARRRTGITLLASSLPMAMSGYLLQTSVDPWWRQLWVVLHVATSICWLVVLTWHVLRR